MFISCLSSHLTQCYLSPRKIFACTPTCSRINEIRCVIRGFNWNIFHNKFMIILIQFAMHLCRNCWADVAFRCAGAHGHNSQNKKWIVFANCIEVLIPKWQAHLIATESVSVKWYTKMDASWTVVKFGVNISIMFTLFIGKSSLRLVWKCYQKVVAWKSVTDWIRSFANAQNPLRSKLVKSTAKTVANDFSWKMSTATVFYFVVMHTHKLLFSATSESNTKRNSAHSECDFAHIFSLKVSSASRKCCQDFN